MILPPVSVAVSLGKITFVRNWNALLNRFVCLSVLFEPSPSSKEIRDYKALIQKVRDSRI